MVLEVCSYHFILLDQGYVQGIFGVSHGALQFIAYEELKKDYSKYFGTPINKRLVVLSARVCLVDCIHLKTHKFNQVRKPETLDLKP